MHFAHLPAGYIVSKLLVKKFEKRKISAKTFISWGMFGAIVPDLDLIYYFIDEGKHHHHQYFTHFPFVWIVLLFLSLLALLLDINHGRTTALTFIFTFSGCMHTLLDTIAGYVLVFAPFTDMNSPFTLAHYIPWDKSFLEFFVILWALYLWKKNQILEIFSKMGSSLDMIE
ncbi:MAG: metal-dependent hydrolase [Chlorobium sp.]|jgi:ABC-type Na+ efflux pump permease subunit|nr:metal-dependent hydrolase [Chlorobium sp.]